jgi:autoinducer 2-degrading protein
MYIVHVFIHVKPDKVAEFEAATLENAKKSVKESGIARFDLIRQVDDPTRFVLLEVYRSPAGHPQHKETAHYKRWQEIAEPLMAEPRTRIICENVYPGNSGWG